MTYIVNIKDKVKMTIECGNDDKIYNLNVLPQEEEKAEKEINEIIRYFILYNIRNEMAKEK